MANLSKTVRVELGQRSYDVRVGAGGLEGLGAVVAQLPAVSSVVVITDSNVGPLYAERASQAIAAADVPQRRIDFPAGEANKTLDTYSRIMDDLLGGAPAADRKCLVVALGGGVVGDVAGFVAATALRGMRLLQVPTTLLAAVDASVGGKTAVDHAAGKNLIGAFHQPTGVVIDVETLWTLPAEEIHSGLAECVKHALIRKPDLLDFIEHNAQAIVDCDTDVMTELIAENVAIKAAVVAEDERESGVRAHLNFGHTIGHAIETAVGFGTMTHGQGVALGMVAETHLAISRGLVDGELIDRLESVLTGLSLATRWPDLDAGQLWQLMQHDKKAQAGRVRMVLPTALGQVDIFDDTHEREVVSAIGRLAP